MKIAIIFNPNAGRAKAVPRIESFESALETIGANVTIESTQARGDAVRLADELAPKVDVVGVIGGDGTIHEAVNGMMKNPAHPTPLIVVPYGAGNDLASVVNCPRTPAEMVDVLTKGYATTLDVLDFGERFCINSAGLGFEGQVNKFSQSIRVVRGHVRYMVALAKALASFSCFHVRLTTAEGGIIEGEKLLVSIGNGVRTGGAFYLTPDARPDDGLIDVCIVEPMGRIRMLGLLPKSFKGNHVGSPEVTMLRTRSLTIECEHPYPMHIDGEYVESPAGRRTITVCSRAIPVLCKPDGNRLLKHPPEKIL